jgi:hypothetical protein
MDAWDFFGRAPDSGEKNRPASIFVWSIKLSSLFSCKVAGMSLFFTFVVENGPGAAYPARNDRAALNDPSRLGLNLFLDLSTEAVRVAHADL